MPISKCAMKTVNQSINSILYRVHIEADQNQNNGVKIRSEEETFMQQMTQQDAIEDLEQPPPPLHLYQHTAGVATSILAL